MTSEDETHENNIKMFCAFLSLILIIFHIFPSWKRVHKTKQLYRLRLTYKFSNFPFELFPPEKVTKKNRKRTEKLCEKAQILLSDSSWSSSAAVVKRPTQKHKYCSKATITWV